METWACLAALALSEFQLDGSKIQTDTVPEPWTRRPIAGYNWVGQFSLSSASMNYTQTQTDRLTNRHVQFSKMILVRFSVRFSVWFLFSFPKTTVFSLVFGLYHLTLCSILYYLTITIIHSIHLLLCL